MQQLREALIDSFNRKVEKGEVAETVDKQVDHFIKSTLEHVCSSWGDVAKAFEKRLSEDLCSRIERMSLEQYNDLIVRSIQGRLDGLYLKSAKEHLEKLLDQMFERPKDRYLLSEIVKMVKEEHEDSAREDGVESISLHVEDTHSLVFIYIDAADRKKPYECGLRLTVDKDSQLLCSAHRKDEYRGVKPIRPDAGGIRMGKIDALLFQAIAFGAKVDIDRERSESETHYPWAH